MIVSNISGGGSFDHYRWIYVHTNMDDAIEAALSYFSEEHNRDDECDDCRDGSCEKNLIESLRQDHRADFECTDYVASTVEIWKIRI